MLRLRDVLLAGSFAAALTATAASRTGPTEWPIREAPAALQPAIAKADLVIADVHGAFLRELRAKLAKGGPLLALGVCHMTPQLLARRLRERDDTAAGFTSDRLRSLANAPPAWAVGVIARHAGEPAQNVDGYAVELGSRLGVLRPIVQQPICASCHGPAEQLDPRVRDELGRRYPADRAIGFAPGEIRGWYWVEMPRPAATAARSGS
jgi:hypothetical protein